MDTSPVPEEYIHRIGRTGRAQKDGVAINLSTPAEESYIEELEKLMNKRFEHRAIPANVKISTILTEEEMPVIKDKNLNKNRTNKEVSGPAFHEKKEKNKKVNLGGPGKREKLKGKNAKIRTRRHNS